MGHLQIDSTSIKLIAASQILKFNRVGPVNVEYFVFHPPTNQLCNYFQHKLRAHYAPKQHFSHLMHVNVFLVYASSASRCSQSA